MNIGAATSDHSAVSDPLRMVARIHRMRTLGLGAGAIAVAGVLYENGASWLVWALLCANGFVWPVVAYFMASRSADPHRAELRNLAFDSAAGGFWVAMMQFNVLPSAVIVVMLSADKLGVGGWRLLRHTATLQLVTCALTAALLGFPFKPESSMFTILLSLPFMFTYPLAISAVAHALSRKVVRQNRQLDQINRTDGLTGLSNRANWEETARHELERALRTQRPAALMMLDIDDFKRINDQYGHPTGDAVLCRVADTMRDNLRSIDTPARFGGDEFGAVLVELESADAVALIERIRSSLESARFDEAPGLRFTVSIGIAMADASVADAGAWVRQADAALYRAKQAGRNRVQVQAAAIPG